jgi:equilibrative nucleoside transporter 1/2/3
VLQLDAATAGSGGLAAFAGVCVVSAAFGVAGAHVQGGMVGDLSLMCPEFVQVCIIHTQNKNRCFGLSV